MVAWQPDPLSAWTLTCGARGCRREWMNSESVLVATHYARVPRRPIPEIFPRLDKALQSAQALSLSTVRLLQPWALLKIFHSSCSRELLSGLEHRANGSFYWPQCCVGRKEREEYVTGSGQFLVFSWTEQGKIHALRLSAFFWPWSKSGQSTKEADDKSQGGLSSVVGLFMKLTGANASDGGLHCLPPVLLLLLLPEFKRKRSIRSGELCSV